MTNQPNNTSLTPEELEIQGYIEGQDKQIMWLKSRISELQRENGILLGMIDHHQEEISNSWNENNALEEMSITLMGLLKELYMRNPFIYFKGDAINTIDKTDEDWQLYCKERNLTP